MYVHQPARYLRPSTHIAVSTSRVSRLPAFIPTALMDFVGGNLDEYLHPERHAAQLAEQPGASVPPAAEVPPPPLPPDAVPPQVQYNPNMKVGGVQGHGHPTLVGCLQCVCKGCCASFNGRLHVGSPRCSVPPQQPPCSLGRSPAKWPSCG